MTAEAPSRRMSTAAVEDQLGPSDAELLVRARERDSEAFAELWRRHRSAAESFARVLVPPDDASDVVSEAVAATWSALNSGAGPTSEFRPYLFRAVRNNAIKVNQRRQRAPVPTENLEALDPRGGEPLAPDDDGAVIQAFQSLPPRWQAVLWYTEVDCESVRDVATILGMGESAVYALARRAREGLRQAYVTAHTAQTEKPACRWVTSKLASYTRGKLSARQRAKVEAHLQGCLACTDAWLSVENIAARLPVVLPVALGGIATHWVQVALGLSAAASTGVAVGAGASVAAGASSAAVGTTAAVGAATAAKVAVLAASAAMVVGMTTMVGVPPTNGPGAITAADTGTTTSESTAPSAPAKPAPTTAASVEPIAEPTPTAAEEPIQQRREAAPVPAPQPTQAPAVQPTPVPTPTPTSPPVAATLGVTATADTANGVWAIDVAGLPAGTTTIKVSDSATGRSVQFGVAATVARTRLGQLDAGPTHFTVVAFVDGTPVAQGSVSVTP